MMKYLLLICLLGFSACGPAANSPSQPAANPASANGTTKVLANKQAYLDFLACAKAAETSATHQGTIQSGIDNVNGIPDAAWETLKTNLAISAQDFVTRYPTCVK